tara:strand:+ start:8651 stop:9124 length:474 start_codon:yes stop_codon:yes gene_type:complete
MTKIIFLVVLILINAGVSAHADSDEGYKHYLKGNYDKALIIWKKEIDQGKKEAFYNIGLLYFFGKGVEKNLPLAFDYCKKAAFRGSARAQNNLAYMFMEGLGTKKDLISAYAWSKIAIENGYKSHKIRDNVSMHLTPAMQYDAEIFILKLKKGIYND